MAKKTLKISREWIASCRKDFRAFLRETKFPDPKRNGKRGSEFEYPEWLIMFVGVLAVKAKVKTYKGIHRLVTEYWDVIGKDLGLKVISERQLRDRLKKICFKPGKTPVYGYGVIRLWGQARLIALLTIIYFKRTNPLPDAKKTQNRIS